MYLFEFEKDAERDLVAKILVASNELENKRKAGELKNNWTKEQLYKFFAQYKVPPLFLDQHLDELITDGILKKTITNRQGNEIVFKGNKGPEAPEAPPPEKSKDVVDKMAKKAMKK